MLAFYLSLIDDVEEKIRFETMYETYKKSMWYTANDILHDYHLAEDATQEAFLNIAKNFKDIRTDEPAQTRAFVNTVTRHIAIRMAEKKQKYIFFSEESYTDQIFEDPVDYEEKAIDNDLFFALKRVIPKINYKYNTVLELYVQGYTYKQIASILDISLQTVKVRVYRAKKMALKMLEEKR